MEKTPNEQIKGLLEQIKAILNASQQFGGDLDLTQKSVQIDTMNKDINRLDFIIGERNEVARDLDKLIKEQRRKLISIATEQDLKNQKERKNLLDELIQLGAQKEGDKLVAAEVKEEIKTVLNRKDELIREIKEESNQLTDLLEKIEITKEELSVLNSQLKDDKEEIITLKINEKKNKNLTEEIKTLSKNVLELKTEKRLLDLDIKKRQDELEDIEQSVEKFKKQMNAREKFLKEKEKRVNSTAKTLQKHLDRLKIPIKL